MMYHHYSRSTAPARPQKRFWYSVAFIWFARLWVSLYKICVVYFSLFFIEIVTLFGAMLSLSCSTFHSVHYVLQKKTHRIIFVAAALPFPLSTIFGSITKDAIFMHLRFSLLLVFFSFSSFSSFSPFSFTSVWVCVWRSIALCLHFKFLFLFLTASLSHY